MRNDEMTEAPDNDRDDDLVFVISYHSDLKQIFFGTANECLNWARDNHKYASTNLQRLQLDPNFLFGPAHLLVNLFVAPQNYFQEFKRSVYWKNAIAEGEYRGNEEYSEISQWVSEFVELPVNILFVIDENIPKKMVTELYNKNLVNVDQAKSIFERIRRQDFYDFKFTEEGKVKRVSRTFKSELDAEEKEE